MQIDWQTLVALGIVVIAFVGFLRSGFGWWNGQKTGGCATCPSKQGGATPQPQSVKALPLVQLQVSPSSTEPKASQDDLLHPADSTNPLTAAASRERIKNSPDDCSTGAR